MKILALDTSSHICSVALLMDEGLVHRESAIVLKQAQIILSEINLLLESANITINQLDAIAFGCGPGSFTGVRITASVTQGLAYALKLPVIPISSMKALAYGTYLDLGWDTLLVGIDARMGEIYCATYSVLHEKISLIGNEYIDKPEKILIPLEDNWFGVGNAWEVYRERIPFKPVHLDSTRVPQAKAIAYLAKNKFLNRQWVQPHQALPVYLRDNVAKKTE